MATFDRGKQRLFLSLAIVGVVILVVNLGLLAGTDVPSRIKQISIPYKDKSGQDTPPDPNVRPPVLGVVISVLTVYPAA